MGTALASQPSLRLLRGLSIHDGCTRGGRPGQVPPGPLLVTSQGSWEPHRRVLRGRRSFHCPPGKQKPKKCKSFLPLKREGSAFDGPRRLWPSVNAECLDTMTTLEVIEAGGPCSAGETIKWGTPYCLACFFLIMPRCFLLSIKLMLCPTRFPTARHSLCM